MFGLIAPVESVTYGPVERARVKVEKAEAIMEQFPQTDCPIRHHFAPGVYVREMTVPKGVLLTGAVHKTEHLSILSKGHILIVNGAETLELRAPATVLSPPGVKRAIMAVEESVWSTIHATNETDTDKLVEELTESKASELLGGADNRQLALGGLQQIQG